MLTNLLGNAVKFTEEAGSRSVWCATPEAGAAIVAEIEDSARIARPSWASSPALRADRHRARALKGRARLAISQSSLD